MAYASWSVTFGEQPSAAKWNILGTNDSAFNDGTGLPSNGASSNLLATGESATSTSYTGLATAQTVTVTVGATGKLLVIIGAGIVGTGGNQSYVSFALSGANTLASADKNGVSTNTTTVDASQYDRTVLLTGLNPGSTTVTFQARVGGGTGTFKNRNLVAIPL